MRRVVAALLCLLPALSPAAVDEPRASPYDTVPALRALMDWVTLQVTFDHGTPTPDMAAGDATVQVVKPGRYAPGLRGQALVTGADGGQMIYRRGANAALAGRGAVSLWLQPVDWTHQTAGNNEFLMTTNYAFYLERQGPVKKPDGHWERLEALLYLVVGQGRAKTLAGGCSGWGNGTWHLVVANWNWPTMSLSVDGGDFATMTHDGAMQEAGFGDLLVGCAHDEHTLLDEFTVYRRPLALDEARLMYRTLLPATEAQP